ncbi:histidine permease YuiF [Geomicrobium sp. JCM 19038]|nr:histidine permease YuiF [Geomicrobium sp. JCM 19038]
MNAVVIAVLLMIVLSLMRVHVVISLIIAASSVACSVD